MTGFGLTRVSRVAGRRHAASTRGAREADPREHPKLAGPILTLTADPQSTKGWQQGAEGEELLAGRLTELPDTFRVMHDGRIPGTQASIDHIAIGPSAVWVIDAKRYKNRRPALRVEGGILRPRIETLRIGGRDGTELVDGVRSQVDRVSPALEHDSRINEVLCFLEADWPLIGGSFIVNDIQVRWPRPLVKQVTRHSARSIKVGATYDRLAAASPIA